MPSSSRGVATAERVAAAVLFAWLLWLPLPFGSNVEIARRPLILTPLILCAFAACVRLVATRWRANAPVLALAWKLGILGGLGLIAIGIVQLVPLPLGLLHAVSPASHAIWTDASNLATLAGVATPSARPISIDPGATAFELFRLLGLVAAFQASTLLIRNHARRVALAVVVSLSALFQTLYGVREAAMGRYAIWGWVNRLIFDRVTGTFVNPNHFAHYVAISLPMALFIAATAWHEAAPGTARLSVRLVHLFERRFMPFAFAILGAIGCVAAILLAQSRGGLLALSGGLLITGAILPGRRLARAGFAIAAVAVLIVSLVILLGSQRTMRRLGEPEDAASALTGRRVALAASISTWRAFPILGSGLGTFQRVADISLRGGSNRIYHHAHDDYAEIAATAGTLGFVVAIGFLAAAYLALVRQTIGPDASALKWNRRAFQIAALASLTIAMVHALFDFNFFIPANPATLATILGAAVTVIDHDLRRSGGLDDSATRR